LIQSLTKYSDSQKAAKVTATSKDYLHQSGLLLHVQSIADYYTTNKTLMQHPPSVRAELILDPYQYNIVPESLRLTAGYILILAVCSWFLSSLMLRLVQPSDGKQHQD
jgi:hypothetical protein